MKCISKALLLFFIIGLASCGVEVTEITLSESALLMKVDDEKMLTVETVPADQDVTITWTSSEAGVASVSEDGVVKAIANGSTTITASYEALSATCEVTVSPEVTDFSFDDEYTQLQVDENQQLEWTILPAGITASPSFTSADESVVTVSEEGLVTAVGEGQTTVTGEIGGFTSEWVFFVYSYELPETQYTHYVQVKGLAWGTLNYQDGSPSAYYLNKTDLGFDISTGEQTFTLTLDQWNTGQGDMYVAQVHADWNGDGDFADDGEELYSEDWSADGVQDISITVTVPADAAASSRVRTGLFFKSGHTMSNGMGWAESGNWIDFSYQIK